MKCFKCGTLLNDHADNCSNCGQSFRKIKKEFSPSMYSKMKSLSSINSQQELPLGIQIGDSISEQYIIHDYTGNDLIFHSFIGIDSFNKQKVQIDFVKATLLKSEHDKSHFINSLREEKFRQHENLSIIYDYGKHNSNYYIVSEYIDGVSLKQIIDAKEEHFTLEEVEPIIAQITDALTDIHEDSLIGYLIPQNIVIMKDNLKIRNTFWFRCFDSKTVLKYFSSDSSSYHYLAPELRGGSPKLINATDLYALGVIISSLLTGKLYKGVSYNLTEYNEALPYEIDSLFFKLINKNANKRYQNVEDFIMDFDELFTFTSVSNDDATRVVSTADILAFEDKVEYDFEDEMETSMVNKQETQDVIKAFEENKKELEFFEDDENETQMMPKKEQTFEEEEHETTVMPKKEKEKNIKKTIKKEEPPKKQQNNIPPTKKTEEEIKDSNTSYHSYKNPFYEPDKIEQEQETFKQQKEFQDYQKSVYQQLSDFKEKDSKKSMFMMMGFFVAAMVIILMFFIMFMQKNNQGTSTADKLLVKKLELMEQQLKLMSEKNKKLDKEKNASSKDVLIASKEREDKENEMKKNADKLKEIEAKKLNTKNEEEKRKLEEEEKKEKLQKEKLQKELEEKKKKEEEKKKKDKEVKEKIKKEKEVLAKKRSQVEKSKSVESKKITNKKVKENLAKKKAEAKKKKELAKKKLEEKRKADKKKEEDAKQKALDAEADAMLAAANKENKKETLAVVNSDGKCPKGMVKIKAGAFSYGSSASDSSRGPHDPLLKKVTLNTYCIDRYESRGPVSFAQAVSKCNSKQKRICTTQEWEKGCKGKYNRTFPYGKTFDSEKCNTANEDGDPRTYKKTGSLKKCRSPYGLYDMSGNLSEWTKNGTSSRQILKGGSYKSEDFDSKCSSVKKVSKTSKKSSYGYRCCKDL